MIDKFSPETGKVYFIEKFTMYHLLKDGGSIEVDFKKYLYQDDKLIFLDKGQYVKFLDDGFEVRRIEFAEEEVFRNHDTRILFKHLVSLGYINFKDCADCQRYLYDTVLSTSSSDIIDVSSKQWYWQNPFHASKDEYHVIFDVKDVIDAQYKNHLSNNQLSEIIGGHGMEAHALYKQKIGLTIKSLLSGKRMVEAQKEIAFTDKSIKEIAFDFGYKDPSYFIRTFKGRTGLTPAEFRLQKGESQGSDFAAEFLHLLDLFHMDQRKAGFYAEQMHMSVKTLSKKVQGEFRLSLGQLIRMQIIHSAQAKLEQGISVKEIAFMLGFEEANHFSSFFKHYTSTTPSDYLKKKYHQ